ncbi:MAG TPA: YrzE family protein [Acidimicrobiia bacterium]|nr:YrzE family protein [Acidimicrobiia bacterium]
MTITEEQRNRLVSREEDSPPKSTFQRSGVIASLFGMLAGLGMFVLLAAIVATGTILLDLEFDLVGGDVTVRELSVAGLSIAIVVLAVSAFVGGFVAGRIARHGGMLVGIGSGLWLSAVLVLLSGATFGLGAVSDRFEGFDFSGLSQFDTSDLTFMAAIVAGSLFAIVLLVGLTGGRLGQEKATTPPMDVDSEDKPEPSATQPAQELPSYRRTDHEVFPSL